MNTKSCRCGNPLSSRQTYCSRACKQKAYRLRTRGRRSQDTDEFEPENVKTTEMGAWTGRRRSTRVFPPPPRYAHQTGRQRRGSRLRVRDDIAVRESSVSCDTREDRIIDRLEASNEAPLFPRAAVEQKWRDIADAAHKGDTPGVITLLRHYGKDADPMLRRRILYVLKLTSPDPRAWEKAREIALETGTLEEQNAVARCALQKIGVENVIRTWIAEGMSVAEMSQLLGPVASRATIYRIRNKIEKEKRMNAQVVNDLADLKLGQLMQGEKLDAILERLDSERVSNPLEDYLEDDPDSA
jgi:hypothetical protein